MPSIKILDYTIQGGTGVAAAPAVDASQYVARDEFEALKTQISGLKKQLDKLKEETNE